MCIHFPPVIPKVTKHLLSNPVFTCIILAACMEIAVVAGFAAFLGKYLEQQFNLTTTSANQLLGMPSLQPPSILGLHHLVCAPGSFSQAWRPFRARVWGSSWAVCWWRSSTCLRWEPSAWPCWSTWSPPPATSPFCSWDVTLAPSPGWRSATTTGNAPVFKRWECIDLRVPGF